AGSSWTRSPIGCGTGPFRVGVLRPDAPDSVVGDASEIEIAAVLARRGDRRMVLAIRVPERFEHASRLVEMDDAASIDVGKEPFIACYPARHAASEGRHF